MKSPGTVTKMFGEMKKSQGCDFEDAAEKKVTEL